MIVDVFMFDDDFDMLDCRIYQLKGVVDHFFAIEADSSFSGIEKPYYLSDSLDRYQGVPLTIIRAETKGTPARVPVREWIVPGTEEAWGREAIQRNAARRLINELDPTDIVLYGDLDEIPRTHLVKEFAGYPRALAMDMLVYSTSLVHPSPWMGTVIGTVGDLGTDALDVRDRRWGFYPITKGGWHLSWFGDPESRERKLTHHSHQELVPRVGGKIGSDLPTQRIHVDGSTALAPYHGDVPDWVRDGLAPAHWTQWY
jgi:hypothetical protein